MPSLRVDGGKLRIHYRDAGTGPPVVLVHGFPFDSGLWEPQIRELSRHYRVIAPDLRGFGASDLPGDYSVDRLADDVAELIAALGLKHVVLGGLSMGGYVAFSFYRRHAELLNGLILSDTRPDSDSDETRANRTRLAALARRAGSAAVADELLPGLLAATTRGQTPDVVDALRTLMTSQTPGAIESALFAMANRADSRSLLPKMQLPVLVTGGAEDSLTPPGQIEEWAAKLPDFRLAFIPGAGHVVNLERPDEFNALVTGFLGNVYTEGGKRRGRL